MSGEREAPGWLNLAELRNRGGLIPLMSTTMETERVTLGLLRSRSKTRCVVKFSPDLKESVLALPNFVSRERYISRRPFEANEAGVVEVYRFVEDATLPGHTISLQADQEAAT